MNVSREIDDLRSDRSLDAAARRGNPRLRAVPEPLPLSEAERAHFPAADFVLDASGSECFVGLDHEESIEYVALSRKGLDNNDEAFLRYIELGDRHAAGRRGSR